MSQRLESSRRCFRRFAAPRGATSTARSVPKSWMVMSARRSLVTMLLAGVALTACSPKHSEEMLFPVDAKYIPWVGKPAGDLKFSAIDGRAVDLAKLKGKVVLLDFWATWCGPCMKELPHLKEVFAELHSKGFEIVGISFDQTRAPLEQAVRQHEIPWPQYFAGERENEFGKRYGISHFPSMWLVDQEGIIRYISAGADLKEKVLALMRLNTTVQAPVPPPPATKVERAPTAPPPPSSPEGTQHLKLTGFSGTTTSPLLLLNSGRRTYTFAVGEAKGVQTPSGELQVRCLAVNGRSARFAVGESDFEVELKVY